MVRGIAERPARDPQSALRSLSTARIRSLELTREHARRAQAVRGERDWYMRALDQARDHVDELNEAMRGLEAVVAEKDRQIEDIRSERAYRAAVALRRTVLRRGR